MRVEIIKSTNTNNSIKVTRDNGEEWISIEFDFFIDKSVTSIFELPEWAKCQDETFIADTQAKFIPNDSGSLERTVQTGVIIKIIDYNMLYISSPFTDNYKGIVGYESTPTEDRGIIINGVRVYCITPGTGEEFATMLSVVRNHTGGLIASKTLDSSYKNIFNLTTIALCDEEYQISPGQFAHTYNDFLSLLKGKFPGSWVYLVLHGKKYKTILKDGTISSREVKTRINNKDKLCKVLNFILEEV